MWRSVTQQVPPLGKKECSYDNVSQDLIRGNSRTLLCGSEDPPSLRALILVEPVMLPPPISEKSLRKGDTNTAGVLARRELWEDHTALRAWLLQRYPWKIWDTRVLEVYLVLVLTNSMDQVYSPQRRNTVLSMIPTPLRGGLELCLSLAMPKRWATTTQTTTFSQGGWSARCALATLSMLLSESVQKWCRLCFAPANLIDVFIRGL